jgi:hypothetical protein
MSVSIREKIEAQYNLSKQNLVPIIFGSYEPEADKLKLIALKDHLISSGYTKTALVEDYPDDLVPQSIVSEPERIYAKSVHLCRVSHCNLIVATHDGQGRGWINELAFCCRDCPDGIVKTTVFDEQRDSRSALGVVNLGMVSLNNMRYEPFCCVDDLKSAGERTAFKHVIRLLERLTS